MLEELKIKTETYYALQKLRIQAQLRIKAFVRDNRLDEVRAGALHFWLDEHLSKTEDVLKKEIATILKDVPIWTEWLKDVLGIGPCLAGSLHAGIFDISRFMYVSSLWAYCGYDVRGGEAPRRQKGHKINWSPFLRMTMYKVTDSFIKQDPDKCLYRRLYAEKKAYYQEKFPEYKVCNKCGELLLVRSGKPDKCSKKGCKGTQGGIIHSTRKTNKGDPMYIHTKDHLHNMAKRYAGKIFLQHLWVKWREIEGLPVTQPWIIAHGGHEHYIEPDTSLNP